MQARVMATIGVTRGLGDHDLKVYNSNIYIKPFLSCVPEVSVEIQGPYSAFQAFQIHLDKLDSTTSTCFFLPYFFLTQDILPDQASQESSENFSSKEKRSCVLL